MFHRKLSEADIIITTLFLLEVPKGHCAVAEKPDALCSLSWLIRERFPELCCY